MKKLTTAALSKRHLKWIILSWFATILTMGGATYTNPSSGQSNQLTDFSFGIEEMPEGYRDWRMISIAQLGAPANDLRVKLGNDLGIEAYRQGKRSFPDGTIIARLAYRQAKSEENNEAFRVDGKKQGLPAEQIEKLLVTSFVAGTPTNVQFMVKDSRKYASTGGWGFAQFTNGKPDRGKLLQTCFSCHAQVKNHDFVFTQYAP